MSPKQIIVLGTYHAAQRRGHALNATFSGVISLIRETYGIEGILEEWWDAEESFASTLAGVDLQWKNVGTPDEEHLSTYRTGLNCHPPTHDPTKPILQEYGPLDVQELRENYMVDGVRDFMSAYDRVLFIVGIAHLHSILLKLGTVKFDTKGYSWIEQK